MSTIDENYPKKSVIDLSDEQVKQLAIQNMQRQEIKTSNFPTEIISLPSKGLVYSEGSFLRSGTVEMKYMTAREEDILTSQNLIKQGIVLDTLMKSMIVSPINFNELVIGDKNALMIAARVLGYGKDYSVTVTCPECANKNQIHINLAELPEQTIPENSIMITPGVFEFTLPQSKRIINFKLMNTGINNQITKDLQITKKSIKGTGNVDRELTTRLKYLIVSVDENSDRKYIENFVDNEFFAMDSKALRTYIKSVSPDLKFQKSFVCNECNYEEEALEFVVDTNFFWPKS